MAAAEAFRPLRRVEYDQLVSLGVFEGERVELLEGALVAMSPIGAPHNASVQKLDRLLQLALNERALVRCQMSFVALDISEPEPDLAVVPLRDYDTDHPDQAYLIVEVAESSVAYDRGRKRRVYASCGVPEYWIVNIPERCIEVYREPDVDSYVHSERYVPGQTLHIAAFSDVSIAVSDVIK